MTDCIVLRFPARRPPAALSHCRCAGQLDPEVATKLERVVASSILRTLGDAEVRALASMAKATVMQLLEAFAQRVSNREFDTEKDQRAYFVYGLQDLAVWD